VDLTSRVQMTGPLAPYRDVLRTELLARGYRPLSAENLIRVTAHLSRWLEAAGRPPSDLTAARIEAFLQHRRAVGYTGWRTAKGLVAILEILRHLRVIPHAEPAPVDDTPAHQLLRGFERHLVEERGNHPSTAAGYRRLVETFVEMLEWPALATLSAEAVSRFIRQEARSTGPGYLKLKVTAIRAFLRYLHVHGHGQDLSAAVPAVAGHRLSGLPKAIPEESVRRIEASCDRTDAAGRRAYAIVLLLSRLGLRATEIAALTLEDVHWGCGEIVIRGKGSEGVLPLSQEVGEALVDYLKHGRRRATSRRFFLPLKAPHRAISSGSVTMIFRHACRRAGLAPMGAHRLRHTAATVMLRRGASLPEIGQVLRHTSLVTTAIYAKVDLQALHPLARPWPGGAA